MVSNYRVAPVTTTPVQPIVVQSASSRPLSSEPGNNNGLLCRQKQCLVLVAVATTLVVAVAVGAAVLVWLTVGGIGRSKNAANKPARDTRWNAVNGSNQSFVSNSTSSYLLSHTMVGYIDLPESGHSATVEPLSADSTPHFQPCSGTSQIQCRSDGKCIPAVKRCNKVKDCVDASDEFNCSCVDFLRSTSPAKLCDGYADCPDEEDEKGCASNQCHNGVSPDGTFRCTTSHDCIPYSALCDGKRDCPDGQDELECWMLAPNVDATRSHNHRTYYDFGYAFQMKNGVWYPVSTEGDTDSLGRRICEKVQYSSLLYSSLRPATDSRINGCLVDTGKANGALNLDTALQLRSSCPNKMALYVACDDFICGDLPYCRPARKRVVGGTDTGPFCNPWAVALYRDGEMSCQAVILNHLWLITAAHCFTNREKHRWTARLGMYRQSSWSPYAVTRNVVSIIRHPNFTDSPVETNDIALIRLDRPVSFNSAIQPPCLARHGDNPQDGDICTVVGWGYMIEDGLQFADELRRVDLTVISNQRCNSSPTYFRAHITDGHICLGHGTEKKDACQGDSGGPLLCARSTNRTHYLAGITSTGDGCARANVPGIWTRLSVYIDWIQSTLSSSVAHLTSITTSVGPDHACSGFQCDTGECVYNVFRCDGGWDCQVDGSDELYCADAVQGVPLAGTSSPTLAVVRCGDENGDGYLCSDGVTCLSYHQRCDYLRDCPGGDDEENCYYCLDSDIPCNDTRRCLPFSIVLTSLANRTVDPWLRHRFDCH